MPDEKIRYPPIKAYKAIETGNVTEVVSMSLVPKPTIRKIDNDSYIILSEGTGELHTYTHNDKKVDNIHSLKQSFQRLRRVINANSDKPELTRWLTLTYAENMQNLDQLYLDFKNFNKRFRYYLKSFGLTYEYIAVPEPQKRGAWHLHVIVIFSEKPPYIDNNEVIAKLWSHGFTKFQTVTDIDNLGAYLSAYLTNLETDDTEEQTEKKYIKGGRLKLYPQGMNIYRTSRGIKKPIEKRLTNEREYIEYRKQLGSLTFSYDTIITDKETDKKIYINKSYYNKRRK